MKILLISPCTEPDVKTPKPLMIPQLALHILAGLTPPHHEIKLIEEEIEDISFDEDCDLVGISCMTGNAPRAYQLAAEFRKRGKKVVLGGVHPTILPDEAGQHADSVVIGEAEGVWADVLNDVENGRLQPRYHKPGVSLDTYVPTPTKARNKKGIFGVIPIMTTRGCPYNCEFCCVSDLFGKKIRHVPIANVVRDIEESAGKVYIFLDDNIIGDPKYAKELFRAIKPMKIKWAGQASISFVHDYEMMKLAADAGCGALFFGLESVSTSSLSRMRKSLKSIDEIETAIRKVRDMGIHFHASMVFGFDSDTTAVFPETLDFLIKNRISTATLNVLTPYPGTRVYQSLKAENRIINEDWLNYNHSRVVFTPKNMTPFQLQAGRLWVRQQFTSNSSIVQRLPANLAHPLLYLAINAGSRFNSNSGVRKFPEMIHQLLPQSQTGSVANAKVMLEDYFRELKGLQRAHAHSSGNAPGPGPVAPGTT